MGSGFKRLLDKGVFTMFAYVLTIAALVGMGLIVLVN
jgi:hypothetical protein